ncbi:MAG: radical SAM protein [Sciscionella sp.]
MTPPTPAGHTRTAPRVVAARSRGNGCIVYDPLTGLTHHTNQVLDPGRLRLDPTDVAAWPVAHPSAVQDRIPLSVCWSPLVRCNLGCPHCLDDKTVPELPGAQRPRIARLLADSPVLGVDISGGEPLLLRDLPDLIDILVAGGCAVSVTTNGTHLARRAEALATRVDALRISLDGPDAARHDHWRGPGSFDRALAGIRAALAHGIPTQIHTVLMRSTRASAQPMVQLAAALGAYGVTFLQMLPLGDGAALAGTEQLSDDDARDVLAHLHTPASVAVRLRSREAAGGFTVIRADGRIWRNQPGAQHITRLRPLHGINDLALAGWDGSA